MIYDAHPKFVCAREGHEHEVKVTITSATIPIESYVTRCRRCRAMYTVELPQR